jgi:pepF/M3 family oligoendopeptidase
MTEGSETPLPHWDMSIVYPGLDSVEFKDAFQSLVQMVDQLVALFDRYDIISREPFPVDDGIVQTFEMVLDQYNAVLKEIWTLETYLNCFINTNSRNELAQAKLSEFKQQTKQLPLLNARFAAWIASLDLPDLLNRSATAQAHVLMLQKSQQRATHLMSPVEEALVAEMILTGSRAWTSLYHSFVSQLTVPFEINGKVQDLPIGSVRKLAYDPDRKVRQRAYKAELAEWERVAIPLAAALNSIKGEQNMLSKRRRWDSPLDSSLFQNNINHQVLDALMEAIHEAFPDFRDYLQAKARALHLPILAWYDLNAPVGESKQAWSFEQARQFIIEQFEGYSPKMGKLAERAFQERWIDAEPRPGKIDISWCFAIRGDESRILVNYKPTFFEVSMLAHELGHAYHNLKLAQCTAFQRFTPLPMTEIASTFCQTLIQQAGLQQADLHEQITILDSSLQFLTLLIVETTIWFMFEKELYEHRLKSELSLKLLKQKMLELQQQVYGEGLDPKKLHPYTWAAYPHMFISSFYNFQYSFGTLFSLGLYGRYLDDPDDFKANFDELLSLTGMVDVADLAFQFGIDLSTPDFWRSSLDVIRADINQFKRLVEQIQENSSD